MLRAPSRGNGLHFHTLGMLTLTSLYPILHSADYTITGNYSRNGNTHNSDMINAIGPIVTQKGACNIIINSYNYPSIIVI